MIDGIMRFPGAAAHDPAVDAWLSRLHPDLGDVARTWFGRLRDCGDDVAELLHDGHPTACVGDAAFAYVDAFSAHVNVGFFFGADLPDPAGLLQGSGRRMRHVKLGPGAEPNTAALQALIDAACSDIRARLAVMRGAG